MLDPQTNSPLIDSHTHLDQFPNQQLIPILERALEAGIGAMITVGTSIESSQDCINLAQSHPRLYAGVGIHPDQAITPVDTKLYKQLKNLATSSRVVTVSEVGLDFLPGMPSQSLQEQVFRSQIHLAKETGLAIIYHSRQAGHRALHLLIEETAIEVGFAAHYFQGSWEEAAKCLDAGGYLSIAKTLFRSTELQDVVRKTPLERIILETDSFPQPWKTSRKDWTEPQDLQHVAAKVASLKGLTREEVAQMTSANLERLLKVNFL